MELFVQSLNHPLYMLSTEGRVFSRKTWRFLKHITAAKGFIQVSMDGRNVTLHKEMAKSFANVPVQRVWFKNGEKSDCRLENLDWTLRSTRMPIMRKPKLFTYEKGLFKEEKCLK